MNGLWLTLRVWGESDMDMGALNRKRGHPQPILISPTKLGTITPCYAVPKYLSP